MTANACHAAGDGHRCQSAAVIERIRADACHAVGNGHRGQVAHSRTHICWNTCHIITYNKLRYLSHNIIERSTGERRMILSIPCHRCQSAAVIERHRADACHAVADGHRCQSAAARERIRADACHAVADGHRCQSAAIRERLFADACYAVGDGHRCQSAAVIERRITYTYSSFLKRDRCVVGHGSFIFVRNITCIYKSIWLAIIPCCIRERT